LKVGNKFKKTVIKEYEQEDMDEEMTEKMNEEYEEVNDIF
jgi:hypothetical protein